MLDDFAPLSRQKIDEKALFYSFVYLGVSFINICIVRPPPPPVTAAQKNNKKKIKDFFFNIFHQNNNNKFLFVLSLIRLSFKIFIFSILGTTFCATRHK